MGEGEEGRRAGERRGRGWGSGREADGERSSSHRQREEQGHSLTVEKRCSGGNMHRQGVEGWGRGGSDGGALRTNIGKGKPTLLTVFIDRSQPARPRTIKRCWSTTPSELCCLHSPPDLAQ